MNGRKNENNNVVNIVLVTIGIVVLLMMIPKCSRNKGESANNKAGNEYELNFSESFNKGLATQDELGLSVVIAVDCSGSMEGIPSTETKKKYIIASEAITEIVQFLKETNESTLKKQDVPLKIGILKFNNVVSVLWNIKLMNSSEFDQLLQYTSNPANFTPNGYTAIGLTIEKAAEMLMQSGTIFKSMIIISDGENTQGVTPEKSLAAMYNNRNNKNTQDFPIYTSSILTSFVCFDIGINVFSNLNSLGARITAANNKKELLESLKSIFIADISKLEMK